MFITNQNYQIRMKFNTILLASIITFILAAEPLKAIDSANHSVKEEILFHIFNFNFDQAENQIRNARINNRDKAFLKIELRWWQAIEKGDKKALHDFSRRLKQINKSVKTDLGYLDLITKTYSLRHHMAKNNYPAAIVDYFRIKELMREEQPKMLRDNLSTHIYSLYSNLMALAEISYNFNPFKTKAEARKAKHIKQIKNHSESDDFIRSTLGHYFLFKYFGELAHDQQQANLHREVLQNRFPDNRFFRESVDKIDPLLTKNTK